MPGTEGDNFAVRGRVFDGARFLPDGVVEVEAGRIKQVASAEELGALAEAAPRRLIVPGFIDIHVHGALGADFADGDPASPPRIARHLVSRGTTGFVATLVSSAWTAVCASLESLVRFGRRDPLGEAMLGVHFEGPFINPAMRGAHAPAHLKEASPEAASRYLDLVPRGYVRAFTVAPELDGGMDLVEHLLGTGAFVALGHSRATYDQALQAMALGVTHATHLFNAMGPLHHRQPGLVGAFLDSREATVEVIPDGVHVHPALLRLIARVKGPERTAIVTDAIPAAGLPAGTSSWQGRELTIREGGAYFPGSTLAGSLIDVPRALEVLAKAEVPLADALRMASETPARLTGTWHERGSLAPGKRADLVLLDSDLRVERVYLAGRLVHPSAL